MSTPSAARQGEDTNGGGGRSNIPEQRAVVGADGAAHVVGQEAVHGVAAHARRQAEDFVGDGADLDADPVLLHHLHDVGVPREREAVADALGAEQQGVDQVAVGVGADIQRLAAVEQEGDVGPGSRAEVLELEKLLREVFERPALALLAD